MSAPDFGDERKTHGLRPLARAVFVVAKPKARIDRG